MKLLYVEDEVAMAEAVADVLELHKYNVDVVHDGDAAMAFFDAEQYDGIILDIMLPKADGFTVLKHIRSAHSKTPVLLLTAKSEVEDRIKGLDLGADDYLIKPFAMGELLARVRAMLRRREEFFPDIYTFGNVSLNSADFTLNCNGKGFTLHKIEYQLMELLMLNKGIYLSTDVIFTKVWGYDTEADIGIVWVYLSYLRKKLQSLEANVEIKAKRNIGYMLVVKE